MDRNHADGLTLALVMSACLAAGYVLGSLHSPLGGSAQGSPIHVSDRRQAVSVPTAELRGRLNPSPQLGSRQAAPNRRWITRYPVPMTANSARGASDTVRSGCIGEEIDPDATSLYVDSDPRYLGEFIDADTLLAENDLSAPELIGDFIDPEEYSGN